MKDEGYICVDLHVHTALSPCANDSMTPYAVVSEAKKSGLDAIAITDHNSSHNVKAAINAGKSLGITVIPGMEIETKEEVHVLTLFDNINALDVWSKYVEKSLLKIPNNASIFGRQLVYDSNNKFYKDYENLLLQSSQISLEKVVQQVLRLGGVSIPAHISRQANGLMSILGFIPPDLQVFTVEVDRLTYNSQNIDESLFSHYNIIVNSDAHSLIDLYGKPSTGLKVADCSPKNIISKLRTKLLSNEVVII